MHDLPTVLWIRNFHNILVLLSNSIRNNLTCILINSHFKIQLVAIFISNLEFENIVNCVLNIVGPKIPTISNQVLNDGHYSPRKIHYIDKFKLLTTLLKFRNYDMTCLSQCLNFAFCVQIMPPPPCVFIKYFFHLAQVFHVPI